MQMTQAELLGLPRWITPPKKIRDLWKSGPVGKAILVNPLTAIPAITTAAAIDETKRLKKRAVPVIARSATVLAPNVAREIQLEVAKKPAKKTAKKTKTKQKPKQPKKPDVEQDKINILPWLAAAGGALALFALAGDS